MTARGPEFGQDPTSASWIRPRLTRRLGEVTGLVPDGYAAYARILHPVQDAGRWVSWSDVAEMAGTRVHALAQWHRLAPHRGDTLSGRSDGDPDLGNLPVPALTSLIDVLGRHTRTPQDCWFCLWEGYGWVHGGHAVGMLRSADDQRPNELAPAAFPASALDARKLVRLPYRTYLLGRGPLSSALGIGWQVRSDWFIPQSPNLFWPADQAWCVASEIDLDSTVVAGDDALIRDLLDHPTLEAYWLRPDDSLQADADHVN